MLLRSIVPQAKMLSDQVTEQGRAPHCDFAVTAPALSLPAHLSALTHTLLSPQKIAQRPWCPCILNGTGCSGMTV